MVSIVPVLNNLLVIAVIVVEYGEPIFNRIKDFLDKKL